MEGTELIEERRSVRHFKDVKVDRELMKEIVSLTRWAPSWANYQICRYTIIDNKDIINELADKAVQGFNYNINSLRNAPGVAVLSYVKGKSGKLNADDKDEHCKDKWEIFDAGISCQTFCLAAYEKNIGTCIMGVIDEGEIAKIISLPDKETVAALIMYGYEDGAHDKPSPRKPTDDIIRFID